MGCVTENKSKDHVTVGVKVPTVSASSSGESNPFYRPFLVSPPPSILCVQCVPVGPPNSGDRPSLCPGNS